VRISPIASLGDVMPSADATERRQVVSSVVIADSDDPDRRRRDHGAAGA